MLSAITGNTAYDYSIYNGIHTGNMVECLDDIIGIQEKLFDFGLTISGFQFVGLVLENNTLTQAKHDLKVAHFLLSLGFIFSLFGSFLSYINFKFIRSIKYEENKFIVYSIKKYKSILILSYMIPYFNSMLFLLPVNILIHNMLDLYYGIIFNIISFILFIFGVVTHQIIIVNKQKIKLKNEIILKRKDSS